MMTKLNTELLKIGLTANQATVYLALIESHEAKAGELIKKTGLHRNLVYVALQELAEKKLISYSNVKGIMVYKALSSSRLLTDIQEKEIIAKGVIEELSSFSKKRNLQEIIIYEGIDEFRRHVARTYSTVQTGGLIRYLGISPHWYDIVGPSLENEMRSIQIEKKIKMKAIASSLSPRDTEYIQKTKGLTQVKINPLISGDTSGIEILDNRISIRSFIAPYFVVEISHKQLAENYQRHFDFLWKQTISH
jgi:sugar-specific transcriptional regulator TrmB